MSLHNLWIRKLLFITLLLFATDSYAMKLVDVQQDFVVIKQVL